MSLRNYSVRSRLTKPFCLIIFSLLLSSTFANVFLTSTNGNLNLAIAQSSLSSLPSSPDASSNPVLQYSSSYNNQSISPGYSSIIGKGGDNNSQIQEQQDAISLKDQSAINSSRVYHPTTREYTLIAENTTLEIAPGLRVDAWTYNGTMPGPTITAVEGDRVIVHFINKTPLPHTVHFHGDHPSEQDGVFEEIGPNGTYTYDFIAHPAGALGYHCHVPPVMQHVRMGLSRCLHSVSSNSIAICKRICFSRW